MAGIREHKFGREGYRLDRSREMGIE